MSKMKPETKRKRIQEDILKNLKERGLVSQIYQSKLQEYMDLYDHGEQLQTLSLQLKDDPDTVKTYMDCIKEIRQIRKAMRDTLDWLGVTPEEEERKEKERDVDL